MAISGRQEKKVCQHGGIYEYPPDNLSQEITGKNKLGV